MTEASFSVIPVLDLKAGAVVRARAGERAAYRPIETPLARGSAPEAVLEGLLSLAAFRRFYIADLDAIERGGDHRAVVESLVRRFAGLEIWVDGGFATAEDATAWAAPRIVPVLGTETLRSEGELARAVARLGAAGCNLSLDYRGDRFIGPPGILDHPESWPAGVIAMTLARIGIDAGPDLDRVGTLRASAIHSRIFAAGGVRHDADLAALAAAGAAGVLVASALHDGRLSPEALRRYR